MQASLLSALMDKVTISNIIWTQFFHNIYRFKHILSSMRLPILFRHFRELLRLNIRISRLPLNDYLKALACIVLLDEWWPAYISPVAVTLLIRAQVFFEIEAPIPCYHLFHYTGTLMFPRDLRRLSSLVFSLSSYNNPWDSRVFPARRESRWSLELTRN